MNDLRFPALPVPGDLILNNPAWLYPSPCAAGSGMAHLRIWTTRTAAPHTHLAIVSQMGIGASVTNSATSIHATLTHALNGPVVLLEHWPEQESHGPEHLDQVTITAGQPDWRRIWPTSVSNPDRSRFETWMNHHGHPLLTDATAAVIDTWIWGPHCLSPQHDACPREMCSLTGNADHPCRSQKLGCPYCGAPREPI
ncbi:hypothetical protein AB0D67_38530 [Streptosporangium sp. NPDC048047]|uniref:hypothetical protein n=1 Tax=Streptosporangium sp. NPDC048047 TaxID=3155748 RepID=UPI0034194F73